MIREISMHPLPSPLRQVIHEMSMHPKKKAKEVAKQEAAKQEVAKQEVAKQEVAKQEDNQHL